MKTLKMSIVIVMCFIVCWTPYYLLGLWYWFFPDDIEGKVSHSLTHILFIFGLFNACLDPIIYGLFTIRFRKGLRSCYRKAAAKSDLGTNITEPLKSTTASLPSKRGTSSGEKDRNCGQVKPKPSDGRRLTVFIRGEGGQKSNSSADSTAWWGKQSRTRNFIVELIELVLLYIGHVYFTITSNLHV